MRRFQVEHQVHVERQPQIAVGDDRQSADDEIPGARAIERAEESFERGSLHGRWAPSAC
jgi:hypothetical protein